MTTIVLLAAIFLGQAEEAAPEWDPTAPSPSDIFRQLANIGQNEPNHNSLVRRESLLGLGPFTIETGALSDSSAGDNVPSRVRDLVNERYIDFLKKELARTKRERDDAQDKLAALWTEISSLEKDTPPYEKPQPSWFNWLLAIAFALVLVGQIIHWATYRPRRQEFRK